MIHPNTRLQFIDDHIGYGVFATAFIPAGTLVYVKDKLEREITPEEFRDHEPELQAIIEKYSYIDERGIRIVSWDMAKYVNHCCNCNTMSTGYGFEIAIRDIQPGEEITDEYGLFNLEWEMEVQCRYPDCRHRISGVDFDLRFQEWDEKVKSSLDRIFDVEQPLLPFLEDKVLESVIDFLQDRSQYRSVYYLKYQKNIPTTQSH